jgi:hypothetical protein
MAAYRIAVEALDPATGEEGHESLSFFASTTHDIFATVNALRSRVECSACTAAKLAVAISLLDQSIQERRHEALFTPLHQAAAEVLRLLESVPVEALS